MRIGIDLGGSHIGIGFVDNENHIIIKKEHNWTEEEKQNKIESIIAYCKKFIKELLMENEGIKIEKIGVGYPYAAIQNGIVYMENNILDLPSVLQEEFHVPVDLKNDVKCSALCEKTIGNLQQYNNCLFMTLGTGIGGAYFYQNELVKPNKFQGFEIGHMVIDRQGKICKCGRKGCFEQYASMKVFRSEIEHLFSISGLTSDKMFKILESKEKEKEVQAIIDNYVTCLAEGIINLINILEPDAICIGGSFAYYAPIFMEKLKSKVKVHFPNRDIPDLIVAKFANDAGIIGASMLESN